MITGLLDRLWPRFRVPSAPVEPMHAAIARVLGDRFPALPPGTRPSLIRFVTEDEWERYAAAGYPDDWPGGEVA